MIPVGTMVRLKKEARVTYGENKLDDVVPAGALGIVHYRPKDDDHDAHFDIGVAWRNPLFPDKILHGIEVLESEVDVLPLFDEETLQSIKNLLVYSFRDIQFNYAGLTQGEKKAVSREVFAKLVVWATETGAKKNG